MSRKRKAQTKLPAFLRGELQGLVAIRALDELMKGSDKKIKEQEAEIRKFFHGDNKDPNRISHISMFSKDEDNFADLFEPDPDRKAQRQLRKIFHPSDINMILGKHIKQSCLEQAKREMEALITGRQLLL